VPALRKRDVYEVRREGMQLLLIADRCPNQQQPCRALSAIPEPQPEELTVTVNGRAVSVPQGASLYDAAAKLGAFVPILCKHPRLPNTPGACRCVPCLQQAHAAAAAAAPHALAPVQHIPACEVWQGKAAVWHQQPVHGSAPSHCKLHPGALPAAKEGLHATCCSRSESVARPIPCHSSPQPCSTVSPCM
jgi:hypothetical protein